MSTIQPIFKLNFEQTNGTLTDLTGNGYDATVNSTTACTPVANDPEMGRCLQFDGTAASHCIISQQLSKNALANGFTMTLWVNVKANTLPYLLLLHYGSGNIAMQINTSGEPYYWNSQTTSKTLDSSTALPLNSWQHLAVTVDTIGEATIYINGQKSIQGSSSDYKPLTGAQTSSIVVGGNSFNGMMAWMALYDGPLGQADILADMAEGQAKRVASFRQSMPIDFKLYSDDGGAENPIMFIEDEGAGEDLNLRIVNNSSKPITYQKNTDPVSSTNYHFQLRFRPGVLSENFLNNYSQDSTAKKPKNLPKLLANNPNWTAVVNGGDDSVDTISFLYNGTTNGSLDKGLDHLIVVSAVNASATGGSRNTNVELRYANIQLGAATTPVTGYRKQNISIVNHSGEKEIPLRAEIIGNTNVMTYAKPSDDSQVTNPPQTDLMFQIVNTGTKPLPLALPDTADNSDDDAKAKNDKGETTFTLSIDVQPENHLVEWALVSEGVLNDNSLVLNKLGLVREVEGASITLEGPLIEALTAGTTLDIGGASFTVASSGAMAGAYQIPLTTNPTNIQKGAAIQLPSDESSWITGPVSSDNTPPNTQQWAIKNQSQKELAPGAGLSFMLKGIECSLPAGSSVVTISYQNVPGHWDGQFELLVQKSPMAFNQNLIGVNTNDPEASLHIVEQAGITPFAVQVPGKKPAALPPAVTLNKLVYDLIALDRAKGLYMSSSYQNGDGDTYQTKIWTINGPDDVSPGSKLVTVPGVGLSGTTTANNLHYNDPYICLVYGPTGSSQRVNLFTYDDSASSLTHVTYCDLGHGTTEGNTLLFHNGYALTGYVHQGGNAVSLRSYNIQQNPAQKVSSLSLQSIFQAGVTNLNPLAVHNGYLYFVLQSSPGAATKIYACSVSADGSFGQPVTIISNDYPFLSKIAFYGDYLYCGINGYNGLSGCQLFSINISNPANPIVNQLNDQITDSISDLAVFDNFLVVACPQEIIIYDLLKPAAPRQVASYSTNQTDSVGIAGIAGDYMWVCTKSSNTSPAKLFDLKSVIKALAGHGSFISSEAISIGTAEIIENTALNLPYPKNEGNSGIAIGDASLCQPAAFSMFVPENSAVSPVAINDANGKAIFNIKMPLGTGVGSEDYRVGIGINNPQAPLHVTGGIQPGNNLTTFSYLFCDMPARLGFESGAKYLDNAGNNFPYSIVAENQVQAFGFVALSDIRIKDAIAPSDASKDLNRVLGIKISDYTYLDFVGKGTGRKKGLIAQHVKEVFPQAVSDQNTDFIPDIYAMATDVGWQPVTKHLSVHLEKAHDLKVGDKVRLIAEKGFEEKEVVAVPDSKSFVVSEWEKPVDKLFVFGKEVHDFHTVDYDQVAMLGVSAIQALHAEMEDLKKENEALKAQMQTEMAELKAEWAAFKSSITKQHQN